MKQPSVLSGNNWHESKDLSSKIMWWRNKINTQNITLSRSKNVCNVNAHFMKIHPLSNLSPQRFFCICFIQKIDNQIYLKIKLWTFDSIIYYVGIIIRIVRRKICRRSEWRSSTSIGRRTYIYLDNQSTSWRQNGYFYNVWRDWTCGWQDMGTWGMPNWVAFHIRSLRAVEAYTCACIRGRNSRKCMARSVVSRTACTWNL